MNGEECPWCLGHGHMFRPDNVEQHFIRAAAIQVIHDREVIHSASEDILKETLEASHID